MKSSTAQPDSAAALGRQLAVFAAAYGAVMLWGATPMATKVAVAGLDPLAVGLLRTLLAAVAALPLIVLGRLKPPASREGRAYLAVSALGGFVIFPVLFSLGLELTTAGHGALLLGILPVLTGLIAALLDRIRIDRTHIVGSIDPVNPVYIYKVEQIHAVDGIADGDSHQPRSALDLDFVAIERGRGKTCVCRQRHARPLTRSNSASR